MDKNATGAKVGDRLPGANNPEGDAVAIGFVAEVREAGGVGRWKKDEGLLGEFCDGPRATLCPWDSSICFAAEEWCHFNVLQWLRSQGCPEKS